MSWWQFWQQQRLEEQGINRKQLTEIHQLQQQSWVKIKDKATAPQVLEKLRYKMANNYREDFDQILVSCDQSLEVNPALDQVWIERGYALRNLGRNEEAIASYDKALEINPNSYQAWTNRGYALDNLGRQEEVITSYHKAYEILGLAPP